MLWRVGCAGGPESYYNMGGRPLCDDTPRLMNLNEVYV